jgi:hypothetical protein
MKVEQLSLVQAPTAPLPRRVDLRHSSVESILRELEQDDRPSMRPHLVTADPPWPKYNQQPGHVDPAEQYELLSYEQI